MEIPLSKSKLALFGGMPVNTRPFAPRSTMGKDEARAAYDVVLSGELSGFLAAPGEANLGGRHVRALEHAWADLYKVRHAVSVNSWTSGLVCAVGALCLEPGDEVIIPPWTMSATAAAVLHWNAIPVFADVEPRTFNIDPSVVEALVSPRTRAIIAVDIFGLPANVRELKRIGLKHGVQVISDSAQTPWALDGGIRAGTLADIGGYSLNYHKHIHSGEGGIIVTDDDYTAQRMRLIRNHAESLISGYSYLGLANMIGFNFRMTEVDAAIAAIQLARVEEVVSRRRAISKRLVDLISTLPGLEPPFVPSGVEHDYYILGLQVSESLGVERDLVGRAITAEGIPGIMTNYVNLHRLPAFVHQQAFGSGGFPWSLRSERKFEYGTGVCPVAEALNDKSFLGIQLCNYEFTDEEIDMTIQAIDKVWANLVE